MPKRYPISRGPIEAGPPPRARSVRIMGTGPHSGIRIDRACHGMVPAQLVQTALGSVAIPTCAELSQSPAVHFEGWFGAQSGSVLAGRCAEQAAISPAPATSSSRTCWSQRPDRSGGARHRGGRSAPPEDLPFIHRGGHPRVLRVPEQPKEAHDVVEQSGVHVPGRDRTRCGTRSEAGPGAGGDFEQQRGDKRWARRQSHGQRRGPRSKVEEVAGDR